MSKLPQAMKRVRALTRSTRRRLRALGLIKVPTPQLPQTMTCHAIWLEWVAGGAILPPMTPAEALREYRFIRKVLGVKLEPPPISMFAFAAELNGDHNLTLIAVRPHLGKVSHAHLKAAALELGLGVSGGRTAKYHATPDDIFALFPEPLRTLIRTRVDRAISDGAVMASSQELGRGMVLPPALRLVAIIEILRLVTAKRVPGSIGSTLRACEKMASLGLGTGRTDDLAVLAKFAAEENSILPRDARQRIIQRYGIALRGSRDWITNVSVGQAQVMLSQLPDHDPSHAVFVDANKRVQERAEESPGDRHDVVVEAWLNTPGIERAVENRMGQLRLIHLAYLEALEDNATLLAAGVDVPFPVVAPAVLSDGQLGSGDQVLNFRLMRADKAVLEGLEARVRVHDKQLTRNWLTAMLKDHPAETLPILVVFDGAQAIGQADCHEPFFIDQYRWSVFDPRCSLSATTVERRSELLRRNGLPFNASMDGDLLKAECFERQFARLAATSDAEAGLIVVPLVPLFHAMLYAEYAFKFSRDTGGRALELQQTRLNDAAIKVEPRDGKDVTILKLRAKGIGPLSDFKIEPDTALLIPECALFTATRWFGHEPGQRLTLPSRELISAVHSRPLPAAQYLFQSHSRCLMTDEITMALHALLWDLSGVTLHDRRYVKATERGDAQMPEDMAKREFNHSPTSNQFRKYDRSPEIRSAEEARTFSEQEPRPQSYPQPVAREHGQ